MGYGDYSHAAHEAILRDRARLGPQQVFQQRSCHPLMNPRGVKVRESRDSAAHPNSLAIAFALDVTGSMGHIPRLLATKELPKFMSVLGKCQIADPQVLFLAVGDATSDRAPLQVGQFETTAELMDQWLTRSFLESGGGSGDQESYELALYFLAQHTDFDCWARRGRRGYAFLTGDERPYEAVSRAVADAVCGDLLDEDIPTTEVVAAVAERYHPFFLIPDAARAGRVERAWRDLLGDYVITMRNAEDTCFVAAGAVALGEGAVKDLGALEALLVSSGAGTEQAASAVRALERWAAVLADGGTPALPGGTLGSLVARASGMLRKFTGG